MVVVYRLPHERYDPRKSSARGRHTNFLSYIFNNNVIIAYYVLESRAPRISTSYSLLSGCLRIGVCVCKTVKQIKI